MTWFKSITPFTVPEILIFYNLYNILINNHSKLIIFRIESVFEFVLSWLNAEKNEKAQLLRAFESATKISTLWITHTVPPIIHNKASWSGWSTSQLNFRVRMRHELCSLPRSGTQSVNRCARGRRHIRIGERWRCLFNNLLLSTCTHTERQLKSDAKSVVDYESETEFITHRILSAVIVIFISISHIHYEATLSLPTGRFNRRNIIYDYFWAVIFFYIDFKSMIILINQFMMKKKILCRNKFKDNSNFLLNSYIM